MALSTSAYSASFADPSRPEIKKSFMVATLFSFIIFLPQYPDACIGDKGHPCPT